MINPTKSEFGKVSENIVENINKTVRKKLHCNQGRNTSNFLSYCQQRNCLFIQLHIEEFHLLITKHLMLKAIKHAKLYTSITQHQLDISCTSEKPYYFQKINLGRKQLMNHYLI